MTIFRMETDSVRNMANQLFTNAEDIRSQIAAVSGGVYAVEWVSNSRDMFVAEMDRLVQLLNNHCDECVLLTRRVEKEVAEWEEVSATLSGADYHNQTTPSSVSTAGVVDDRPPVVEWLGDNTPLAFIPGFTPPAGGDIETIDSRLAEKFGRDVNLVDGSERWTDYEAAAIDRAVQNLPDSLAKDSLVRNIYRDSSDKGDSLAFWLAPHYDPEKHGTDSTMHEASSITFLSSMPIIGTRQGSIEAGQRVETVVFHELVHSAQFQSDGSFTDITQSYIDTFGWSKDEGGKWSYSGDMRNFPGESDSFLGNPVAYPTNGRTGLEDMAEAVTYFRYEPETLKKDSPERYEWVKQFIFNGAE